MSEYFFFSIFCNNLQDKLFVSLLRFLKGFYCSPPWVSLLVQQCHLQLTWSFFLQFPVQFGNCYHLPIQEDLFEERDGKSHQKSSCLLWNEIFQIIRKNFEIFHTVLAAIHFIQCLHHLFLGVISNLIVKKC